MSDEKVHYLCSRIYTKRGGGGRGGVIGLQQFSGRSLSTESGKHH
jgi:hypothetical protein